MPDPREIVWCCELCGGQGTSDTLGRYNVATSYQMLAAAGRWMSVPFECPDCRPYGSGVKGMATIGPVDAPSDIPETLEEQVRAILPHVPPEERVPFLAGMRFAQGHAEYGSGMFRIDDEKLEYERLCEKADVYVMGKEQKRRGSQ